MRTSTRSGRRPSGSTGNSSNRESWSKTPDKVRIFSDFLKAEMEKAGFECRYVPVGVNADTLVGVLGKDRPGKPILFCGHMDTVFPTGMHPENPFKIVDGKAYGPGVLDMKGGILIALTTVKALNRIGTTSVRSSSASRGTRRSTTPAPRAPR